MKDIDMKQLIKILILSFLTQAIYAADTTPFVIIRAANDEGFMTDITYKKEGLPNRKTEVHIGRGSGYSERKIPLVAKDGQLINNIRVIYRTPTYNVPYESERNFTQEEKQQLLTGNYDIVVIMNHSKEMPQIFLAPTITTSPKPYEREPKKSEESQWKEKYEACQKELTRLENELKAARDERDKAIQKLTEITKPDWQANY